MAIFALLPVHPFVAADEPVLRLRSFPPDARVAMLLSGDGPRRVLAGEPADGGWRVYRNVPEGAVLELSAPGYRTGRIHLVTARRGTAEGAISVEERLLPERGPLELVAEAPTGESPKSVTFLTADTVAVPLLRAPGIDLYTISEDRWGSATLLPSGRLEPPERWAVDGGFVEPLVLPRARELWISQMTTAMVHRFSLPGGEWIAAYPSGGGWPKVLANDRMERFVWVANWRGESVVRIDRTSGEIMEEIPVGGQPRGLLLSEDERALWVCIFSSGEVVRVDTERGTVTERIGPQRGAARHIVRSPRNGRLYYSDMYYGTVNIIDPDTKTVVATRRVGPNVNTIAFDPDGRYLFVSVRGRNNPESYLVPGPEFGRVLMLDPETLETVHEVYGRHQPTGLAVSPDGRYLVTTDFLDDNVALYRIGTATGRSPLR